MWLVLALGTFLGFGLLIIAMSDRGAGVIIFGTTGLLIVLVAAMFGYMWLASVVGEWNLVLAIWALACLLGIVVIRNFLVGRVSYKRFERIMYQQGKLVGKFLKGELGKDKFLRKLERCLKPIESAEVAVKNLDELCAIAKERYGSEYAEGVKQHKGANHRRLSKYSARGLKLWFSYLETTDGKFMPFNCFDITKVGREWTEREVRNFFQDVLSFDTPTMEEGIILKAASA